MDNIKFVSRTEQLKVADVVSVVNGMVIVMALIACLASKGIAQVSQLTLQTVDGDSVKLSDNRGKVVVLAFNATWVPATKKSLPALQQIADIYEGRGVLFYLVTLNPTRVGSKHYASDADLKAFAEESGWRLSVLRDPKMKAFRSFGLDAIPSVVIIDRNGQVYRKYVGIDNSQPQSYKFMMRTLTRLIK